MVESNRFVGGQHLSLADISIISGFTLLEATDYPTNRWTHICQWILRVKDELKDFYEEINAKAIQNTRDYIEILKQRNNS